jgi:hypothetical protein
VKSSILYLSYVVDSLAVPDQEQPRRSRHAAHGGDLEASLEVMIEDVRGSRQKSEVANFRLIRAFMS